jgi:hypothetical protein
MQPGAPPDPNPSPWARFSMHLLCSECVTPLGRRAPSLGGDKGDIMEISLGTEMVRSEGAAWRLKVSHPRLPGWKIRGW